MTMTMATIVRSKTRIQTETAREREKESEMQAENSNTERCNDKLVDSLCWANYDNTHPLTNEPFMELVHYEESKGNLLVNHRHL